MSRTIEVENRFIGIGFKELVMQRVVLDSVLKDNYHQQSHRYSKKDSDVLTVNISYFQINNQGIVSNGAEKFSYGSTVVSTDLRKLYVKTVFLPNFF